MPEIGDPQMKMSLDANSQEKGPIDNDDTDRFDLDKQAFRTILFVVAVLAVTIGLVVVMS